MDLLGIDDLIYRFGVPVALKEGRPRRAESAPVKSPPRQRRHLSLAALVVGCLLLASPTLAQAPPQGRYRCYQPPGYTVMAWFDLYASGISVLGDAPQAVRIDAATGRIELPLDALPPYRHGIFFSPGAPGGDAGRATIVLAGRADARLGRPGWATLPRCYLTTH